MATEEIPNSSRNTKNDGFKCNICLETFASKRTLNYHNRKRHLDTNLICDICGLLLASDKVLKIHKQIHLWEKQETEEKYFRPMHECPVCDLKMSSPGSLVVHCFKRHPSLELFTTRSSKKKSKSKFKYDENQNKIPDAETKCDLGQRVKCPLCGVFYAENRIKGHFMTAHPYHKGIFCTNCAEIIEDQEKMWIHLLEHTQGNDLYKCEFCECLFISAQVLETHGRLHTSQSPFSCSVCHKEFPSKTGAIAHFHSHLKIEALRETEPQKADSSFAMSQVDTNVAMLPVDKGMTTPTKLGDCHVILEDSEDFVNVWN